MLPAVIPPPAAQMQGPPNVGLVPPPLLGGAVGTEVLQHQERAPAWLALRDDGCYSCRLCDKVATETHLSSLGHNKNLQWYQELGEGYWLYTRGAGPAAATLVPRLPLGWGDPAHYEWKPLCRKFWCRLCGKNADDRHVASGVHQKRVSWPGAYGLTKPSTCGNGLVDPRGASLPNRAARSERPGPPPPLPSLEPAQTAGAIQWQAHWCASTERHSWTREGAEEERSWPPVDEKYFEIF